MAGGGGDDVWLISYADLMTLLFGFFVLMYFFANADNKDEWEKVRREMAQHFGGTYVNPNADLAEEIRRSFEDTEFLDNLDITVNEDALEITFRSTVLFDSGSARINAAVQQPMNHLVQVISDQLQERRARIIIEGHTDDTPISTAPFPSNWELSAARASVVLRELERSGVASHRMRAVAFGESRPLFPNRNELGESIPINQAKNRRVVIRIITAMREAAAPQKSP